MEKEILLSIIIPVYNLERYIIPCIESVINNEVISSDCYEIVIVNDGSTDGTSSKVEQYILCHESFHISLYSQENRGVSAARNNGLQRARGRYVWFIDGDDAIYKKSIYFITEVIRKYKVDAIHLGKAIENFLYEDNTVLSVYNFKPDITKYQLVNAWQFLDYKYFTAHQNYIWERDFLIRNKLEYPVHISQNEDFDFLVRALLSADKAYINQTYCFYYYREREGSVSRQKYDYLKHDKYLKNKFFVLEDLISLQRVYDIKDSDKMLLFKQYLDRYIYSIVADCFFRSRPFSLILYVLFKLKALQLYPMNDVVNVGHFRIWLFNHPFLFLSACWVYRIFKF